MIEIFAVLGAVWALLMVLRLFAEHANQNEKVERLKEIADERIRVVQLEPVPDKGLILAYDGENNQFLGQGTSIDEVKTRIMERFPQKIFLLDNKVFTGLKGNLEAQLENSITS